MVVLGRLCVQQTFGCVEQRGDVDAKSNGYQKNVETPCTHALGHSKGKKPTRIQKTWCPWWGMMPGRRKGETQCHMRTVWQLLNNLNAARMNEQKLPGIAKEKDLRNP